MKNLFGFKNRKEYEYDDDEYEYDEYEEENENDEYEDENYHYKENQYVQTRDKTRLESLENENHSLLKELSSVKNKLQILEITKKEEKNDSSNLKNENIQLKSLSERLEEEIQSKQVEVDQLTTQLLDINTKSQKVNKLEEQLQIIKKVTEEERSKNNELQSDLTLAQETHIEVVKELKVKLVNQEELYQKIKKLEKEADEAKQIIRIEKVKANELQNKLDSETDLRLNIADIMIEAKDSSKQIISKAEFEAQQLVERANIKASRMISEARSELDTVKRDASDYYSQLAYAREESATVFAHLLQKLEGLRES